MYPLVSVIIPVYNSADFLDETLKSVHQQTYPNIEIIIVDDGSVDDSFEIAKKYEGFRNTMIISQPNQGACVARNRGFQESSGSYIQYLDADDLISEDKIASQINLSKIWGEDYLYTCRWDRFKKDPLEAYFPFRILDKDYENGLDWFIDAFEKNEMMASSSWLISRKLVLETGVWNESLILSQDGEFFSRAITKAMGIKFDPNGKVFYRSNIRNSISTKYTSIRGIESNFTAITSIEKALLNRYGNVEQVTRILANKYQSFIYRSYPKKRDLLKIANAKIRTYGGSDLKPPFKGKTLLLSKMLGWKYSIILKKFLQKRDEY